MVWQRVIGFALFGCVVTLTQSSQGQNAEEYVQRGRELFSMGHYESAISDYTEAIRLDPSAVDVFMSRAGTWYALGNYDNAISDYSEAIRLNTKHTLLMPYLAYSNRGLAWRNKDDFENAIHDFTEAIRLNPKLAIAYRYRSEAWYAQGNYDNSISDYSDAIRFDPNDDALDNQLAWLLATCPEVRFRDGKRAVELATKACVLGDGEPAYSETLAAAYAESGDFESAIKWQLIFLGHCVVNGKATAAAENQLSMYRQKKPYREYRLPSDLQKRLSLPKWTRISVSSI